MSELTQDFVLDKMCENSYLGFDGSKEVQLDGFFTIEQLKLIVKYMEQESNG